MLLIQCRVRDSKGIQLLRDTNKAFAADEFAEDKPNDLCGFFINNQLMIIIRRLYIAIACKCSDELSLTAVIVKCAANRHARHCRVAFVDHVCHADGDTARGSIHFVIGSVHTVIQRNKTDVLACEVIIDQVAADGIISSKTVQILDDNAVDRAVFNVLFQPRPTRPVEICTRKAVVDIDVNQLHFGMEFQIFQKDFALVRDGHALVFLLNILLRKANVKGSLPRFYRTLRLP